MKEKPKDYLTTDKCRKRQKALDTNVPGQKVPRARSHEERTRQTARRAGRKEKKTFNHGKARKITEVKGKNYD